MPTAVERLFESFLKLDGIDGGHETAALNGAFLKIQDELPRLLSANPDTFLKLEHDPSLQLSFDAVGDAFLKLGADFGNIATGGQVIDTFFLKLTGSPTPGSVDVTPGPQADFLTLDHKLTASAMDLKILGTDFLKIDSPQTVEEFRSKIEGIGNDFLKLGADMAADRDAFLKLGADFLKLGTVDHPSALDNAYKEFGGELRTVGMDFGALATDFLKLGQDFESATGGGAGDHDHKHGGGGGAGIVEAAGTHVHGGGGGAGLTFMTLLHDFHKLNAALDGLADGAATVVTDLLHESPLAGGHSPTGGGHG